MWQVVYVVETQFLAERINRHLQAQGFMVLLRRAGDSRNGGGRPIEVMVPKSEAVEACEAIQTMFAAGLGAGT